MLSKVSYAEYIGQQTPNKFDAVGIIPVTFQCTITANDDYASKI
jgi:hypothetical protein